MGAYDLVARVQKNRTWGIAVLLAVGLAFAGASQAKTSHHAKIIHRVVKCRAGYARRLVRVPARIRGRIVRRHGKIVYARVWACVKVTKPKPKPKPGGTTNTTSTPTSTGTSTTSQSAPPSTTTSTTITSTTSGSPPPPPPPSGPTNTQLPTITGSATQGSSLTSSTGSWTASPTKYAYQWQDCTSSGCSDIVGQTASTYAVRSSDIGDWIDVVVTATGTGGANSATSNPTGIVTGPSSSGDPVVVAVGDIACPPGGGGSCQQGQTAAVAAQQHPNDVLVLGDNQYDGGLFSEYTGAGAYNATWGVFGCALCAATPIVHPVPGNHEYLDSVDGGPAGGYFRYFGSAIANPGGTPYGYYSFNVGAWHIIALNSNCSDSGCGDAITGYTTGAQNAWLQNDLANDHSACTLAMWHHPLFSSGWTPGSSNMQPLWTALYGAHADIVLNGHDHLYERYAQQDPSRTATTSGIREFVVGTGGESVNGLSNPQTNLQASYSQFGVLVLTLHAGSYDWAFKSTGGTVLDSGTGGCHGSAASSGLAAHIARARPAPLSEPRLTFDARPLHSSLTKATQAGLPVAIHCSQMCDTTIDASLNLNGRPRRIATYVETESQIPGPYVVIHLRLPAHQLHALTQAKLTLRFTAVDANQHHVVLTTTEQLNRR